MASIISAGTTSGTSLNLSADTSGVLQLATNGTTTAVTIDTSQNVGIGTASPASRLDVSGTVSLSGRPLMGTSTDTLNLGGISTTGGGINTLALFTNNTERMRINSGGTVGIGVVPNTWNTFGALELGNGGNFIAGVTGSAELDVGTNAYFNSGWKYSGSSAATLYQANNSNNGSHVFYGAATGTAGNAISWTNLLNFSRNNTVALQGGTSTAGTGITFPATQSASSNANTLDDYEEGTWTPAYVSVGGTNPTVTYSNQKGYYTKIGDLVYFQVFIASTAAIGGTSTLGITLPFTTSSSNGSFAQCYCGFADSITTPVKTGYTDPGQSNMFLQAYNANGNLSVSSLAAGGGTLMIAGFFKV